MTHQLTHSLTDWLTDSLIYPLARSCTYSRLRVQASSEQRLRGAIEEAANELSMIGTGAYGKPMPKQNGAPLRLVVPWKYGFKQIKSIVRFYFTAKRPKSFWEQIQPREYGFWANVNPEVDHPRWSQATEKLLGTGKRVPTLLLSHQLRAHSAFESYHALH